jgi:hypothetical protein
VRHPKTAKKKKKKYLLTKLKWNQPYLLYTHTSKWRNIKKNWKDKENYLREKCRELEEHSKKEPRNFKRNVWKTKNKYRYAKK